MTKYSMAKITRIINLSNLTLIVALALSSVAAYYSIIGLTAIFAGAVIPIIVMGAILEVGKITTTVWLRKYWNKASWVLKLYLVPAVVALALLTSMGIFGFLSKAHMDQGITSGDVQAKLSLYDEKIKTQRDNIEVARKALQQMDAQVDARLGRSDSEQGAERAVQIRRQQAGERSKLQKEIGEAQSVIAKLNEERAPIAAENRKVEAEVGPIKYIAALIYGDNADQNMLESAVRWVIILLVIVFDPLAIALVLAANASKEWDKEEPELKEEPKYEPDDGPLTEDQIDQIIQSVESTEPEQSLLEKHPYLTAGFSHFQNLQPLVAPKEEKSAPKEIKPKKKRAKKEVKPDPEPEPSIETTSLPENSADIITDGVTKSPPFEKVDDNYVKYEGRVIQRDALHQLKPELFMLTADHMKQVKTNFGSTFPKIANKGDIFVRVDVLPNRVFKFNGTNWMTLDKNVTTSYLYDQEYVKYLVDKVSTGEYDLDLLSEKEREQIEDYLSNQNN